MKTKEIKTAFMNGIIDLENVIIDILFSNYTHEEVFSTEIDEKTIFSQGFINAINNGKIPEINKQANFLPKKEQEYHHLIINDECYVMYFK